MVTFTGNPIWVDRGDSCMKCKKGEASLRIQRPNRGKTAMFNPSTRNEGEELNGNSLKTDRRVRFRHRFRHFQSGHLPQIPAYQWFTIELNSVRCSGFSLSLAHSNELELPARIERPSDGVNHRRNTMFRHRFTPFEPREFVVSPCRKCTCDECKAGPFVRITPWFTPISGTPTGTFVSFVSSVAEPTEN